MAWSSFRDAFFLFFRRLGILFAANVLWIILSLPLITMPAATGALFYLVDLVVAEENESEPIPAYIADFWVGFRLYWWQSTKLMLLNVAILIILAITAIYYLRSPVEFLSWLIGPLSLIALAYLTLNIYLLPLRQVYRDDSTLNIIRRAARLVLTYPFESTMLFVWLVLLTVFFMLLAGPVLFILFSLLAIIQTNMLRAIRVRQGEIVEESEDQPAHFERLYR